MLHTLFPKVVKITIVFFGSIVILAYSMNIALYWYHYGKMQEIKDEIVQVVRENNFIPPNDWDCIKDLIHKTNSHYKLKGEDGSEVEIDTGTNDVIFQIMANLVTDIEVIASEDGLNAVSLDGKLNNDRVQRDVVKVVGIRYQWHFLPVIPFWEYDGFGVNDGGEVNYATDMLKNGVDYGDHTIWNVDINEVNETLKDKYENSATDKNYIQISQPTPCWKFYADLEQP